MAMWSQSPTDFRATYGMGITMQRLGRLDEAEKWLTATLTINPGFERAGRRLKQLQAVSGGRSLGMPGQVKEPSARPRRRMTSMLVPEDDQELEDYRRGSREKARIDTLNQHWYGLPWPVRGLQIAMALVLIVGFLIILNSR